MSYAYGTQSMPAIARANASPRGMGAFPVVGKGLGGLPVRAPSLSISFVGSSSVNGSGVASPITDVKTGDLIFCVSCFTATPTAGWTQLAALDNGYNGRLFYTVASPATTYFGDLSGSGGICFAAYRTAGVSNTLTLGANEVFIDGTNTRLPAVNKPLCIFFHNHRNSDDVTVVSGGVRNVNAQVQYFTTVFGIANTNTAVLLRAVYPTYFEQYNSEGFVIGIS